MKKQVLKKSEVLREGYVKGLKAASNVLKKVLSESKYGNTNGEEVLLDIIKEVIDTKKKFRFKSGATKTFLEIESPSTLAKVIKNIIDKLHNNDDLSDEDYHDCVVQLKSWVEEGYVCQEVIRKLLDIRPQEEKDAEWEIMNAKPSDFE